MRLFQPKYKDKSGKTKQVAKWWVEFRDPNGIVRRWGISVSRDVTELVSLKLTELNERSKKSEPIPDHLVNWVREQEQKLRNRIYEVGLLKADQAGDTKLLTEHLTDYIKALRINSQNGYPDQTGTRIKRILDGCGFTFWSDVEGTKINEFISGLIEKGLSRHTGHHYIAAFKQFAHWLRKQGRINELPVIQSVKYKKVKPRAFELDEWRTLLKATKTGRVIYGLTGHERYVLYKLAVETGLRRGELGSLTRMSFNFEQCTVFLPGEHTKNGHDAVQNITPETAELIKDLVKDKLPNASVFKWNRHTAIMIRKDCKVAGIETENYKGTINFHSLRHSCGTFLAARGVHPKVAQTIMRHSDINLTMSLYTHILRDSEADAINTLRDLEQAPAKEQTA